MEKTEEEIKKANAHVLAELKSLQAEHKKLRAGSAAALEGAPVLESPPDKEEWTIGGATAQLAEAGGPVHAHVEELAELSRSLVALRRFVGTNVIAATKIVKKHDKNVPAELQKREAVAAAVKAQSFYADRELPRLCQRVDALLASTLSKLYTGTEANAGTRSTPVHSQSDTEDNDDEDEKTKKFRSMPDWLLEGAEDDIEEAAQGREIFLSTFMFDWHLVVKPDAESGDEDNAWEVDFKDDTLVAWADLDGAGKFLRVFKNVMAVVGILACLYFFICSLTFLADAFRLVAGKNAAEIFQDSEIFNNPVTGVMVGVFVTVLVQSSSTSTSITITMVAADIFTVEQAIPIIMGANIGTSVTSTIVAIGQSGDRDEFRRAFAAATVHDMFNFLSVMILLPIEAATGYLFNLSSGIVDGYETLESAEKPPDILKVITKPFTKLIMQVDKKQMNKLAAATDPDEIAELSAKSMMKAPKDCEGFVAELEGSGSDAAMTECEGRSYLFDGMYGSWSDTAVGWFMLVFSLAILCTCLWAMIKLLRWLLKGRVAVWLHASVNGNVPDISCGDCTIPMGWLSGYLRIVAGFGITICVQSSSITTSALTPLVGVGVITLESMFPTVLGANIGTTCTGLLAALAADGEKLPYTLKVAYSHLFFNLTGIFIWYVIWPMRAIPIAMARKLGNVTAVYRWFPLMYLFLAFFIMPGVFVAVSLWSTALTVVIFCLLIVTFLFSATVSWLQENKKDSLPATLQSWDFLPLPLRSLEPYDRLCCCFKGGAEDEQPKLGGAAAKADLATAAKRLETLDEGTESLRP